MICSGVPVLSSNVSVPSCWICAVVSPIITDEEFVAGRVAPVSSTVVVPVASVMDMFCRRCRDVNVLVECKGEGCSSNVKVWCEVCQVGGVLSSVMVSAPFVRGANTFPTRS